MKILGRVEVIGRIVIQVDEFPSNGEIYLKAPVGSICYQDYELAFEKIGNDDHEWERTTFRPTVQNVLSWSPLLTQLNVKERQELTDFVLKGIETYKQGEVTKEGKEAVRHLEDECIFIGFSSQVQYVMEQPRGHGSLDYIWEHPFSIPTLLFKHKKFPFLIMANGNIDFDDGRMNKSKYNNNEVPFNGISG